MDADRTDAAGPPTSPTGPAGPPPPGARAVTPGRRRRPAARARGFGDSSLGLLLASVLLVVAVAAALWIGWVGLLLVVAVLQVVLARAWVELLEVPGAVASSLAVLAVAALADIGVVVARLQVEDTGLEIDRADDLVQLAPALGVVFLVAVLAQLARRDGRAGVLAGLLASTTGGVLVVGLALWLPVEASLAGGGAVLAGAAVAGFTGLVVGLAAWTRGGGRAPVTSPAVLLPVLFAVLAGPAYVLARITSG